LQGNIVGPKLFHCENILFRLIDLVWQVVQKVDLKEIVRESPEKGKVAGDGPRSGGFKLLGGLSIPVMRIPDGDEEESVVTELRCSLGHAEDWNALNLCSPKRYIVIAEGERLDTEFAELFDSSATKATATEEDDSILMSAKNPVEC
jgi:hypothetical protein